MEISISQGKGGGCSTVEEFNGCAKNDPLLEQTSPIHDRVNRDAIVGYPISALVTVITEKCDN